MDLIWRAVAFDPRKIWKIWAQIWNQWTSNILISINSIFFGPAEKIFIFFFFIFHLHFSIFEKKSINWNNLLKLSFQRCITFLYSINECWENLVEKIGCTLTNFHWLKSINFVWCLIDFEQIKSSLIRFSTTIIFFIVSRKLLTYIPR